MLALRLRSSTQSESFRSLRRFIEAVEITRAQNHLLTAPVLALASEAKPETRELAASMVEAALETLPPGYQMPAETAGKLRVAGVVLGAGLAAGLRVGLNDEGRANPGLSGTNVTVLHP